MITSISNPRATVVTNSASPCDNVGVSPATNALLGAIVALFAACSLSTPLDNLGSGATTTASSGAGATGGGGTSTTAGGSAGAVTAASTTTAGGSGGQPVTYRDVVLADGPIGYWRLGDSATTTALDEIGMTPGDYKGSYLQGALGALTGDPNTAVDFPGTDGRIEFGDAFDLQSLTLELWVKP